MARQCHTSSNLARTTVTSATPTTVHALTFTPDANADYLILWTGLVDYPSNGQTHGVQVSEGATVKLDFLCRNSAVEDGVPRAQGGAWIHSSGASPGSLTITVRARGNGTNAIGVQESRLIALKLGAGDFWLASSGGSTTASSTYQAKVSGNYPAGARSYALIMAAALNPTVAASASIYRAKMRVVSDGATIFEANPAHGVFDTTGIQTPTISARVVSVAGGEALSLEYGSTDGATTVLCNQAILVGLDLDGFAYHEHAESLAESATTATTPQDKLALSWPAVADDWLVLGGGTLYAANGSSTEHDYFARQTQDGASVWNADAGSSATSTVGEGRAMGLGLARVATLAAGARELKLQFWSENASLTAKTAYASLVALALGDPQGASHAEEGASAFALGDAGATEAEPSPAAAESLALAEAAAGELELAPAAADSLPLADAAGVEPSPDAEDSLPLADAAAGGVDRAAAIAQALPALAQAMAGTAFDQGRRYAVRIEMAPGSHWVVTQDVTALSISRRLGVWPSGIAAGVADIELDDAAGIYSPYVATAHGGHLRPALGVEVIAYWSDAFTGATSSYCLFKGFIDGIGVNPVLQGGRTVTLQCRDLWRSFGGRRVDTAIFTDVTIQSLMATVLTSASLAPGTWSLDLIADRMPVGWFQDRLLSTIVAEMIEGGGYAAYVARDGVFRLRDRYFDVGGTAVASFDNNGYGLSFTLDEQDVVNRATIVAQPRVVSSRQVLARLEEVLAIPAGTYAEFFLAYQDPRGNDRVPAVDVLTPAPTSDYLAYQTASGTGTNLTAAMSLTVALFAEAAKTIVRNASTVTAHLTRFQLRGTPLLRGADLIAQADVASSQAAYGLKDTRIEAPRFATFDLANRRANEIVQAFHESTPKVVFRVVDDLPTVFRLELADVVAVTERHSGLDSQFTILELGHEIQAADAGWIHTVEMQLQRVRAVDRFVLDASSLDNDRLGY